MKVWTDREGNKVGAKEFMVRWGEGIQKISPMQLTVVSLMGIMFMLVGVLIGLYVIFLSKTWWLFIILLGSLFLVSVNLIQTLKRYATLFLLEKSKKDFMEMDMLEGGKQ